MRSIAKFLFVVIMLTGITGAFAKPHAATRSAFSEVEDRHITGFNGVNVAGSFDVIITQGPAGSVKVEAPAQLMKHIKTVVEDGVLRIYDKNEGFHWGDIWNHRKIVVYVVAKELNMINLSGSGDVKFNEGISAGRMKINLGGSGDMTGRLMVKVLETSISGSGDMKLSGRAESATVSVSGSGDYTAGDLATTNCSVRVSGSGDAEINASQRVDAAVNGSGDIHYRGGPKTVNKSKSGSGDISGS